MNSKRSVIFNRKTLSFDDAKGRRNYFTKLLDKALEKKFIREETTKAKIPERFFQVLELKHLTNDLDGVELDDLKINSASQIAGFFHLQEKEYYMVWEKDNMFKYLVFKIENKSMDIIHVSNEEYDKVEDCSFNAAYKWYRL